MADTVGHPATPPFYPPLTPRVTHHPLTLGVAEILRQQYVLAGALTRMQKRKLSMVSALPSLLVVW